MRSTLLQGLAGLVLAAGLYFTAQTLRLNRQSADRASESAARTYELEREGQITERFTRAIDQLGNEKLDVRLGGIYALRPTRKLDSHASRLRRKLNPNGESTYIVNVWGVGYRLVPAA